MNTATATATPSPTTFSPQSSSFQHPRRRQVHERALLLALAHRGIRSTSQSSLTVTYKGHLVEDLLIVEVKCLDRLAPAHTAQCLNYLHDSGLRAD